MHDPSKAVGRAIKWEPLEDEKAIDLTLRVSRGAQDTWEKVLDGTLSGASIGARNGTWNKRNWQGKEVPILDRYDLVEVSLVDNPSCPGCDVKVVRAQGAELLAMDVLDFSEEPVVAIHIDAEEFIHRHDAEEKRIGARVSADTRTALHKARDHAMQGTQSAMQSCNCAECQQALNVLDPDGDGDVDILASLDTDNDAAGGSGSGSGGIMNAMKTEITRHLAPTVLRMNGIAARLALLDTTQQPTNIPPEITRQLAAFEQKISQLDEVRASLEAVRGLVEQIAAQPQSGGPIVNSAVLRNQSSSSPYMMQQTDDLTQEARVVEQLSRAGILNKNQQVDAVLYLERKRSSQQAGR
jgi:Caudovirus prohead serine protease